MVILIGSQKGGCGKSTLVVNLCVELARLGKDVILVDADKQRTASSWAMDRQSVEGLPIINCLQEYDDISETLYGLDKRFEYVVVDAAGRGSQELLTGITAADLMVVPFRPSQPDIDTLPMLNEIIIRAKYLNPKLIVKLVLTMASSNPKVSDTQEAQTYLTEFPELQLAKQIICDRKAYRDCMSAGLGVVEINNSKAKTEIQLLLQELI